MMEDMKVTIDEPAVAPVVTDASLAFEDFYVSTHRELYASMWLITRNPHEAEEIAQEAYLRVLERWDRVANLDDPVGYLYRTATVDVRAKDPLGRDAILLTSDTEQQIHEWWFDPRTHQLLAASDGWTVVTAGVTPDTSTTQPDPVFVPAG
jgi:predicted RNA polymerase sigma factor